VTSIYGVNLALLGPSLTRPRSETQAEGVFWVEGLLKKCFPLRQEGKLSINECKCFTSVEIADSLGDHMTWRWAARLGAYLTATKWDAKTLLTTQIILFAMLANLQHLVFAQLVRPFPVVAAIEKLSMSFHAGLIGAMISTEGKLDASYHLTRSHCKACFLHHPHVAAVDPHRVPEHKRQP
jgi:hypothetical protein